MFKKAALLLIAFILFVSLTDCAGALPRGWSKYRSDFYDTFDTIITVMAYARSQEEFDDVVSTVRETFIRLHKLFDIYHNYEGLSNIKMINDNAGAAAVKVDADILMLIKLSKEWYKKTDGTVNIALGSVLKIWYDYRGAGGDALSAKLPPMYELREASRHTDINKVFIDEAASTVYLEDGKCLLT